MSFLQFDEIIEQNDQTAARREHLDELRELVGNVYPNKFDRSKVSGSDDTISSLMQFPPIVGIVSEIGEIVAALAERERPPAEIKDALNARLREFGNVRVAGRLAVPPRVMGKAAFVHLSDGNERLQIYVRRDDVRGVWNGSEALAVAGRPDPNGWDIFQLLDHGDFVGVEGYLFLTNTGELSVHVQTLQFLAKAMLPMPDKMHGIADPELQRRYRYADLIASSLKVESQEPGVESKPELTTRQVFERRAKLISGMRNFLDEAGFIEVETPMLTPKATGAAATPFATHHNALDIPLYARVAPELYLKRLVVGGFEKVYELNRNFRNEGLSHKHNPEFTMLEFYAAYMDVNGMMDFSKQMLQESVIKTTGGLAVEYEGNVIDFGKFEQLTMRQAITEAFRKEFPEISGDTVGSNWFESDLNLRCLSQSFKEIDLAAIVPDPSFQSSRPFVAPELFKSILEAKIESSNDSETLNATERARLIVQFFERIAEEELIQPTFITDYPKSISPLSKFSPEDPLIAERFELFINGMEVANGFSELNDPKEQYDRFNDQMSERERGDDEAMIMDEDYIRALSYGMPPAAGIGIGIDRLVMLLTNKHSIRDVILFPHMRPVEVRVDDTAKVSDFAGHQAHTAKNDEDA